MARTKQKKRANKNENKFKPYAGVADRETPWPKLTFEPGLKGFFLTGNFCEEDWVKEAYTLLNEYADKIYGKEPRREVGSDQNDDDSMEENVDDLLVRDVNSLQEKTAGTPLKRRFPNVFSLENDCMFINTTLENPLKIAMAIVKDNNETEQLSIRFLKRLLPVEVICKAFPNDIIEACEPLFDKYFLGEPATFFIQVEQRYTKEFKVGAVIKELKGLVKKRNPFHQVDISSPGITILVNVNENLCLLSVLPKYFPYRKYNIRRIGATACPRPLSVYEGEYPEAPAYEENNQCQGRASIKVEPTSPANDDSPSAAKSDFPSGTTLDSTSAVKDNSVDDGNKTKNKFKRKAGVAERMLTLEPGLKGFYCTGKFGEEDWVKEACSLLNEYADKIYGKEPKIEVGNDQNDDDPMEKDVEDVLAREVNSFQEESDVTPLKRRFPNVFSIEPVCKFINTTLEDPLKIAMAIVKDIYETQQLSIRFLKRLLPVEVTCKALPNDINEACEPVFDKYFLGDPTTFLIEVEQSCCKGFKVGLIINELQGLVKRRNPLHQVDINIPEIVVFLNVNRNLCFLSVLPKYFQNHKYNLRRFKRPDRHYAYEGEYPEMPVYEGNNLCEGKANIEIELTSAANDDSPSAAKGDYPSSTTVGSTNAAKDDSVDDGNKTKNKFKPKAGVAKRKTLWPKLTFEPGLKGFICTSPFDKEDWVKEAYTLLNEYADKIYGNQAEREGGNDKNDDDSMEGHVDDTLAPEVNSLPEETAAIPLKRRFPNVFSIANYCIFINTTLENPLKIAMAIMKNIYETEQMNIRFVKRLFPVEAICKALPNDVNEACEPLFDKYFLGEPTTFLIQVEVTKNKTLNRVVILEELEGLVKKRNPLHQVDMNSPGITILVYVYQNLCFLSLLPKYFHFRKYIIRCSKRRERLYVYEGKYPETPVYEENNLCEGKTGTEIVPTSAAIDDPPSAAKSDFPSSTAVDSTGAAKDDSADDGNKTKNKFNPNAGVAERKTPRAKLTFEPGLKGFFCYGSFRKGDWVKEAYTLLNEYADKIYGKEPGRVVGNDQIDDDPMEKDVDDALDHSLQEDRDVALLKRRFQNASWIDKSNIFINTTLENPLKIAMAIVKDIDETKQLKTQFLTRLLPVEAICKAFPNDINEACEPLLDKYFLGEPTTFMIQVALRKHKRLNRGAIIEELEGLVKKRNPLHHVDMNFPEIVVFVNVNRSLCLLSVLPKYFHYRKYNLRCYKRQLQVCKGEYPETPVDEENNQCEGEAGIEVYPISDSDDDCPSAAKRYASSSATVDSTSAAKDDSADCYVRPNSYVPTDVKTE